MNANNVGKREKVRLRVQNFVRPGNANGLNPCHGRPAMKRVERAPFSPASRSLAGSIVTEKDGPKEKREGGKAPRRSIWRRKRGAVAQWV